MDNPLMEAIQEAEATWERPMHERLIKVALLATATVIFNWLAENQYESQVKRLKERKRNARSRNHV